jgi:endonuclease/exonuclease/phosphatase (EEP) superfamily protein YafD
MRFLRVLLTAVFGPLLLGVAALSAAAALAAQQGRTSLDFDVLTQFAPFWLAGGLAAALGGGLFFRGAFRALVLGIGLMGAVAAGLLIAPELTRSTGPHEAPLAPGQIKIIQFNTWHNSPSPQLNLDWLLREDPDIAVLEETTPTLRALLKGQPRWHVTCGDCEVVILSKVAPVSSGIRGHRRAPLSRATFRDAHGEFTVLGLHNAWPTDPDQPMQEARLAEAIALFPRERTIVTGDFNSAPWSFQRRRWDAAFGLIRRDRALFSWPAHSYKNIRWLGGFPFLPIDHVYAGSDWATVSIRRGPRLSSDHYPVIAVLAPVSPGPGGPR